MEQCQFSDLAITGLIKDYSSICLYIHLMSFSFAANTEEGISVGLVTLKNGQRSVKSVEYFSKISVISD